MLVWLPKSAEKAPNSCRIFARTSEEISHTPNDKIEIDIEMTADVTADPMG